ncbi:MAG: lysine transporter LysE, partial [Rhodospirillales bacterium 12-71-4]
MPLDPQLFAAFLLAAWVLILTPGPDMLFVVGQALAG